MCPWLALTCAAQQRPPTPPAKWCRRRSASGAASSSAAHSSGPSWTSWLSALNCSCWLARCSVSSSTSSCCISATLASPAAAKPLNAAPLSGAPAAPPPPPSPLTVSGGGQCAAASCCWMAPLSRARRPRCAASTRDSRLAACCCRRGMGTLPWSARAAKGRQESGGRAKRRQRRPCGCPHADCAGSPNPPAHVKHTLDPCSPARTRQLLHGNGIAHSIAEAVHCLPKCLQQGGRLCAARCRARRRLLLQRARGLV